MSEPRTKTVAQEKVRDFMREGCEAVHAVDPGALCVVGPRPYYKLWELNDAVLQPPGSNTLYTFDFFVPKNFVMSDTRKNRDEYCGGGRPDCLGAFFPSNWKCKDVYDTWWKGKPGCHSSTALVRVDDGWVRRTLSDHAAGFATRHNVPVYCNQWGVKNEVFDENGRIRYAEAVLGTFAEHGISSTYWIWRSMQKGGRDVGAPVWGFELVHNDGPHEALDATMLRTLQASYLAMARSHLGNGFPCGLTSSSMPSTSAPLPAPREGAPPSLPDAYRVRPDAATIAAKNLTRSQPTSVRFPSPALAGGVECDPERLEARIDWSLGRPGDGDRASPRLVAWPEPPSPQQLAPPSNSPPGLPAPHLPGTSPAMSPARPPPVRQQPPSSLAPDLERSARADGHTSAHTTKVDSSSSGNNGAMILPLLNKTAQPTYSNGEARLTLGPSLLLLLAVVVLLLLAVPGLALGSAAARLAIQTRDRPQAFLARCVTCIASLAGIASKAFDSFSSFLSDAAPGEAEGSFGASANVSGMDATPERGGRALDLGMRHGICNDLELPPHLIMADDDERVEVGLRSLRRPTQAGDEDDDAWENAVVGASEPRRSNGDLELPRRVAAKLGGAARSIQAKAIGGSGGRRGRYTRTPVATEDLD